MFSAEPVCSWAAYLFATACETAGAARIRSSPRPLMFMGREQSEHSGRLASRGYTSLSSSAQADDPVFQRRQ